MSVQIDGSTGNIIATKADYSGNVSIGGTLTYEDVTNIDSVGLITARNGIKVDDLGVQVGTGATVDSAAANTLTFLTGGSERLRIDSSGRTLVGTDTAPTVAVTSSALFVVEGYTGVPTGDALISLQRGQAPASISSGAQLGGINFGANDGSRYAQIHVNSDGAGGTNDYPGRLVFSTTADGAATPSERLRITSGGLVGIQVTPTQQRLTIDVFNTGTTAASYDGINICNTSSTTNNGSAIIFGQTVAGNSNARIGVINSDRSSGSEDQDIFFGTLGAGSYAERLRITSTGKFGFNTTNPGAFDSGANHLVLLGNTSGTGNAGITIASGNDSYGNIYFADGTSGADAYRGHIAYDHDGNSMRFATNGTERLRIDSSGNIGIGVANPVQQSGIGLHINNNGGQSRIKLSSHSTPTADNGFDIIYETNNQVHLLNHENAALKFGANDAERMRIDSSGTLMIGNTDDDPGDANTNTGIAFRANGKYFISCAADGGHVNRNSDGYIMHTRRSGSHVGGISVSSTNTAFNTSSDYRLKENVVDITDGITRIKQLAPKRFNFIVDADKTVDGFLAHEAQTVVPEAVTGTHNEVDDDGNAVMQGIDPSKLVPLLTAALKEAIAKIETLESEVASLKG